MRNRQKKTERDGPDGRVHGAGDDLWIRVLAFDVGDGGRVAGEDVYLCLCAHVPDAGGGVSARGDEDVEGGVQAECVHAREMAVVLANDLVDLEVPAFDHLARVSPAERTWGHAPCLRRTKRDTGVWARRPGRGRWRCGR